MVVGDSPDDWPPPGYTEDIKVSNGRKIKFYTHVETGKKFYSKKEVTRYMNSKDTWHGVTQVNHQDNSCSKNNVSQNYQDKNCSDSNVSKVNCQDKNFSENNASQIVEGTEKSNEWLPPGWMVELKTRKSGSHAGMTYKVYSDPSTGNKFYSKPEVSKYLKTMKLNDISGEEQIHGTAELSSPNQKASENSKDLGGQSRISKRQKSDTDGSSVKTICSNGIEEGSHSKQKTSHDSEEIEDLSCTPKRQKSDNSWPTPKTSPADGAGDFSNEKASQDSKENGAHSPLSKRKKRGIDSPSAKTVCSQGAGEDFSNEKASQDSKKKGTHSPLSKRKKRSTDSPSAKTVCSVAVECDSVDDLPPGWKKEVTIRQTDRGTRKDPLYTDPVHGYVFRSKKEVFRYLQTGDTSRCTRRSSKRNAASTAIDNSPTAEDASLKKLAFVETGRQLFATVEPKGGKSFVTCSPAQVESSKKQPDCSVSDPNTIITSILAEINESHSCENINEDAEIGLARATESVGVERLLPVTTPQLVLFPKKPLPENEQEKLSCKTVTEQKLNSRNTKSLKPGRRVSKRSAGHGPEVAVDLDLGEHALPAVVEKSASLSLPLNGGGQELLQQSVPTLEPGNSSHASLGDPASSDELPPGWKKEIKITKRAHGIRKDPLYIDPVHGYEFRSKKDVFRYLQTGDISRCAVRPTKRDVDTILKDSSVSQHISGCRPNPTLVLPASLSLPLKVGGQELLQQSVPTLEPGNSSQACLSNPASSDELPPGWKKEIKITKKARGIRKDPLYIDPVHGYGFRSKKDVFRYLQTGDISRCAARPTKRDLDTTMKESSVSQHISGCLPKPTPALSASLSIPLDVPLDVGGQDQQSVTTREAGNSSRASLSDPASSDELPPGWKKEIKITKRARRIRKDPLYIDPVHGYEFRSKKDVFRYLQTGDISRCAVRPTKRDVDMILKESSPTTDASSKNLERSATKRKPSAAEGSRGGKRSVTYSPVVQTRSSKRQSESGASNPNTTVPSADITAKHSYENVIENAEISLGTESVRHSSGDTKVNAESVGDKRISAVSAPKSDVLPKQQLPENEQNNQINKETVEHSKLSRKKKVLTPGHRTSKRLVGQNPELVADLDLGERALRAVVKKSASLGLPLNVCDEEILAQNKEPTVGAGNSDQVSLSRDASVDGIPPGPEKGKLAQNNVPIVGTGNSDQASLSRKASVDELLPSWEKEVLAQNKVPAVGTGIFDQVSLSREASDDELPPGWTKEMLVQNKDSIVGTGYSDQASLSKEASVDELPPGWTKEMLARNDPNVGTGNSHQAFLSREASTDELPPGWTKEMLAQNKNPTVKNFNYGQAFMSRDTSMDDLPPGWTKEMLAQNKNPAVGTGNYQAHLSREASVDELPPGWTKEILARNKNPTVGTDNYQAYLSREASVDDLPPGWTKEMLSRTKNNTVGACNSDQAYLSREASLDELPPGWTKEMLVQNKNPAVRTGKSDQASLSREASVDELPPGWTKEMLVQKKNSTVRTGNSDEASLLRDASVDGLPPGWKKEMRIRKNTCGTKRDPYYTDPVHGYVFRSKKDVVRYLQTGEISKRAVRSTKRDAHSTMQNNSPSTHDANNKFGCSLTGRQLFGTVESKGRKCSIAYSLALQAESSNEQSESSAFNAKTSVSSIVADLTEKGSRENVKEDVEVRLDTEQETRDSSGSADVQQLSGNEKEKRGNKGAPTQSRKFRNNKSFAPVRRVSKRFSQHNPEVMADLDLRECALRNVVKQNALSGIFLDVFGQELPLQTDLETGNFDPTSLSKEATSQGDPLGEFCPSEDQAFKEQKAAMELTSEKQDDEKRIWRDSQPAQISHGSRNVQLKCQEVKEGPTGGELVKEEQDSQSRILENMQPTELAWESGKIPVEDKSTSERSTAVQVTKKRDHEKMQWQGSHLTEPSQRSGDLNVENQSGREKQTGELGTESQDDHGRRLQAQLASYPFGDYWADPCLEFAFKTLTGAIPVEDTLAYQGSGQQEFNTSYTQADDGCFELPLFNTSSYYANDVPNHCAPTEEHLANEQPPINLNQPFSLSENTSIPGCNAVGSQNPGLDTQAKDYQSKIKSQS